MNKFNKTKNKAFSYTYIDVHVCKLHFPAAIPICQCHLPFSIPSLQPHKNKNKAKQTHTNGAKKENRFDDISIMENFAAVKSMSLPAHLMESSRQTLQPTSSIS